MRDKTIETVRLLLTVTGLTLLVVFGARAAGQAENMRLAGATGSHHRSNATFAIGRLTQLNPLFAGVPTAVNLVQPIHTAVERETVSPKQKQAVTVNTESQQAATNVVQTDSTGQNSSSVTANQQVNDKLQTVQQKVEQKQAQLQKVNEKVVNMTQTHTTIDVSMPPQARPLQ